MCSQRHSIPKIESVYNIKYALWMARRAVCFSKPSGTVLLFSTSLHLTHRDELELWDTSSKNSFRGKSSDVSTLLTPYPCNYQWDSLHRRKGRHPTCNIELPQPWKSTKKIFNSFILQRWKLFSCKNSMWEECLHKQWQKCQDLLNSKFHWTHLHIQATFGRYPH